MKIFKFCAAIAITAALMTVQPVFGAINNQMSLTDGSALSLSQNSNLDGITSGTSGAQTNGVVVTGRAAGGVAPTGYNIDTAVPETGSTFALLFLSFLALVGATRLAPVRQRKRV